MKQTLLAVAIALVLASCQTPKENSSADPVVTDSVETAPVALTLKWETEPVLTTCESVIYDKERDVLYVSNIVGQDPSAKDNNGFISKVGLDGKVVELQWVKGLHAPKGMGIVGNKLYVTDIDRVVEIDVTNGKTTKTFSAEGAKFLNDITTDAEGRVYISDMAGGTVLAIENGKLSKWMDVKGPNGLLSDNGKFFVLSWDDKTVSTVDVTSKQGTVQVDSLSNLDGIEATGDGGYLLSSWDGQIHYVDNNWKNYTILDTRADSVNAADIEFIPEKKLLLVPTFFKNTVRAYEISNQ